MIAFRAFLLSVVIFTAISCVESETIQTGKEFIVNVFTGKVEEAVSVSGYPFSYDRKELIDNADALRIGIKKISDQNEGNKVEVISANLIPDTKGKHKNLTVDIGIVEVGLLIKGVEAKIQIFIRKSDGKVVGLYG
jgi:hypothetical protein